MLKKIQFTVLLIYTPVDVASHSMLNPLLEWYESDLNLRYRLLENDGTLLGGGRFPQNFPIRGDVANGPFLVLK